MSFFKEFKDDLSQAVNELMPGEDELEDVKPDDSAADTGTVKDDVDVESELLKLDGLLEKVSREAEENSVPLPVEENQAAVPEPEPEEEKEADVEPLPDIVLPEEEAEILPEPEAEPVEEISDKESEVPEEILPEEALPEEVLPEEVLPEISLEPEEPEEENENEEKDNAKEDTIMSSKQEEKLTNAEVETENTVNGVNTAEVTDETAVITTGMKIEGNITSTGSLDIQGAIKGDIDVQGPVVVDTSAVVVGNIKSRSVQINNGAVIEGFCSQCYADIDMDNLFGEKKGK